MQQWERQSNPSHPPGSRIALCCQSKQAVTRFWFFLAARANSAQAMQRSEEVPVAVAAILSRSLPTTQRSAHYTSWRIRHRHMGRKGKMKNVIQCCGALISRGLDHSHWFFCLSVCTACRVEHSGGRCSHCRWLLCGQRGSLRVDDMHSTDIRTCGRRFMLCASTETDSLRGSADTLRCNLLCNGPKCLLSLFAFDWEAFTCMSADLQ